jgi:2,5-diamino-6-(ribosylamino)-4(3H)-pyrimidinone 5'-phosphate reductase
MVALCSNSTPEDYLEYLKKRHIEYIVSGLDKVNLNEALEKLNSKFGVQTVRVDSGGVLNGVLLRAGLVSEVSVLFHPTLVGGNTPRSFFRAPDLASSEGVLRLKLIHTQKLKEDIVWLRYELLS